MKDQHMEGIVTVQADGLRWVAEFVPIEGENTGILRGLNDGSVVMLAESPLVGPGEQVPFVWTGRGHSGFRPTP